MAGRKLSRWHKASAIVPMAILVGAWGAALAGPGTAVSTGTSPAALPDVPQAAIAAPATVSGDPGSGAREDLDDILKTLSKSGIPAPALVAYQRAESLLSQADPACRVPWNLVAAIGRVESDHGRIGASSLHSDGLAKPSIIGPALNGDNGTARIPDTDKGKIDGDTVWDRAVGPMQFLPATWEAVGLDADGDGKKNPQDIDDAATAAAVYLCAGSGDLSQRSEVSAAVYRYNNSSSYVRKVLAVSEAYAAGDFAPAPDGYGANNQITPADDDATIESKGETAPKDEQPKDKQPAKSDKTSPAKPGAADTGTGDTGGDDDSSGSASNGGGSSSAPKPSPSPSPSPTESGKPSDDRLPLKCIAKNVSELKVLGLLKCITGL